VRRTRLLIEVNSTMKTRRQSRDLLWYLRAIFGMPASRNDEIATRDCEISKSRCVCLRGARWHSDSVGFAKRTSALIRQPRREKSVISRVKSAAIWCSELQGFILGILNTWSCIAYRDRDSVRLLQRETIILQSPFLSLERYAYASRENARKNIPSNLRA